MLNDRPELGAAVRAGSPRAGGTATSLHSDRIGGFGVVVAVWSASLSCLARGEPIVRGRGHTAPLAPPIETEPVNRAPISDGPRTVPVTNGKARWSGNAGGLALCVMPSRTNTYTAVEVFVSL